MRIALLAAGASRRMQGRDKLLEPVDGAPLLAHIARAALNAGRGPVAVTLPAGATARAQALEGLPLDRLTIADPAQGMSASLRAAALWAMDQPLMLSPADMPALTADDFATMANAYDGQPLRAAAQDGTPGHPVVFPPALLPLFAALVGDQGARSILKVHPPRLIALPARHATTDLDTPEDWAAWRAARPP